MPKYVDRRHPKPDVDNDGNIVPARFRGTFGQKRDYFIARGTGAHQCPHVSKVGHRCMRLANHSGKPYPCVWANDFHEPMNRTYCLFYPGGLAVVGYRHQFNEEN